VEAASGDLVMIYDADRTVPAEEVSRFYEVLASGEAEFANGTRTMYPMEDRSIRCSTDETTSGSASSWRNGPPVILLEISSFCLGHGISTSRSSTFPCTIALGSMDRLRFTDGEMERCWLGFA
jgi:hypothetical protein